MTSDTGVKSSLPNHICIAVKDIDKTTKFLSAVLGPLGLGPWDIQETTQGKDVVTVGEPFTIKLAVASWEALGPVVLELIQPLAGNSIWAQFIETKGEGLHHIAYGVPDYDAEVSKLKEQGGRMTAAGVFQGRHWCYFDTEPGGTIFEIMEQK